MKLQNFKGWLKVNNTIIVDETDQEVILRGIALANLFSLEGYLLGSSKFGTDIGTFTRAQPMDRGRTFDAAIEELAGADYAEYFQKQWLRNYITKTDIQKIKKLGFNSIRIPLSARLFLKEEAGYHYIEDNFKLLDEIISWCKENTLYVIIDMHGAPGGQSGVSCDDGLANVPYMFLQADYEERCLQLWEKIAARYKDEPSIAGYEILNEPLCMPKWDYLIPKLKQFYDTAVKRIRAIDQRHILFLQGHRFATRLEVFDHDYDPNFHNWVITTHLYERLPDMQVFGPMLSKSKELNVPVWIGETGGSTHDDSMAGYHWMSMTYEYALEYHIGFCIWTYKSENSAAWLCRYTNPPKFKLLTNYFYKGSPKPTYEESQSILNELLANIKFENSEFNPKRIKSIMQSPGVELLAIGYDPQHNHSGNWSYASSDGFRREDHMHLVYEADYQESDSNKSEKYGNLEHSLLRLSKDESASYTFRDIDKSTVISIVYENAQDAELIISLSDYDYKTLTLNGSGQKEILHASPTKVLTVTLKVQDGVLDLKKIISNYE
ncbi:aryl-phospho-beta-D-glucosidase BglC (GH1 family) [Lactobacillus colini]|uniref:Aryl-phospho-beta-D-glucosidase BglC (GH1 family) n=1 Tax=Lactobacillus colini TaxID=1819254 RepID=A0ABS4MBX9_9LACO|nr:glycoside hydrolase family 5 protein [Lactobacillus colini]MBP2057190.1 aryl-phospho-beta-D-glucosidase BglC (GH1 family) [Lactobacillus colini]